MIGGSNSYDQSNGWYGVSVAGGRQQDGKVMVSHWHLISVVTILTVWMVRCRRGQLRSRDLFYLDSGSSHVSLCHQGLTNENVHTRKTHKKKAVRIV